MVIATCFPIEYAEGLDIMLIEMAPWWKHPSKVMGLLQAISPYTNVLFK